MIYRVHLMANVLDVRVLSLLPYICNACVMIHYLFTTGRVDNDNKPKSNGHFVDIARIPVTTSTSINSNLQPTSIHDGFHTSSSYINNNNIYLLNHDIHISILHLVYIQYKCTPQ